MKKLSLLALGLLAGGWLSQPAWSQADKEREADREAIRKSSQEFVKAFEKGDAKALAAQWTDQGEYQSENGELTRGRAAIEKSYDDLFKSKQKWKVEIEIRSIRFPSRDTAIEDGVMRLKSAGPELPTSSRYSALLVREDGRWKIARVQESGAIDRLEDLAWLIGAWQAKTKDREVRLTYDWNAKKTQIRGTFSVQEGGKATAAGTQTIALDPQTGRLRSWLHDEDGGHGQALWFRDGNRWELDSLGVLADGRETSALNILTRLGEDEFLWRSTQRLVGGSPVPDPAPVKLSRVKSGK